MAPRPYNYHNLLANPVSIGLPGRFLFLILNLPKPSFFIQFNIRYLKHFPKTFILVFYISINLSLTLLQSLQNAHSRSKRTYRLTFFLSSAIIFSVMLNTPQTNSAQDAGQPEIKWFGWHEELVVYCMEFMDGTKITIYGFHPQVLAMLDEEYVDNCIAIQLAQQTV